MAARKKPDELRSHRWFGESTALVDVEVKPASPASVPLAQ